MIAITADAAGGVGLDEHLRVATPEAPGWSGVSGCARHRRDLSGGLSPWAVSMSARSAGVCLSARGDEAQAAQPSAPYHSYAQHGSPLSARSLRSTRLRLERGQPRGALVLALSSSLARVKCAGLYR